MHILLFGIYLYIVKGVFLLNKIIIDSSTRYVVQIKNGIIVYSGEKKEQALCEDVFSDIDAIVSDAGTEIYAAGDSSVECFAKTNHGWARRCVVQANGETGKIKSIKAVPSGLYRNLLYCVYKDGKNMLVHHITGNGINEINTVDCVSSRANTSIASDENGNVNIWYINDQNKICSTSYVWSQKQYTQKAAHCDDALNLSVVQTDGGEAGIAFVRKGKSYNEVCFKKSSQQTFATLGYGVDYNCKVCALVCRDGLYVQWSDLKGCAECKSNDDGNSFMPAADVPGIKSAMSTVCAYRSRYNIGNSKVNLCISCGARLLHENAIMEGCNE